MAQRILNESVAFARNRKQFGQRIGDFRLYEGTTQIQQLIIGRELVGRD